jgi:DNA repair protein RadC
MFPCILTFLYLTGYKVYLSMKLHQLDASVRPQERLESLGAHALSDIELLAMLIRKGSKNRDVLEVSTSLIAQAGSLAKLTQWSVEDFCAVHGLGKIKALQLKAVMEIANRVFIAKLEEPEKLDDSNKVYDYFRPIVTGLEVEKFWMVALNRKNSLIKNTEVTSGTVSGSLIHPRECFREAIKLNASSVIFVHNHPSGDPTPSSADIHITRRLSEAGKVLDIEVLDHLVIGQVSEDSGAYYSFADSGLL